MPLMISFLRPKGTKVLIGSNLEIQSCLKISFSWQEATRVKTVSGHPSAQQRLCD